tara:strand:+ start:26 stop:565 length:540 start_codon:yes stop_codon:yes gene_type:complete
LQSLVKCAGLKPKKGHACIEHVINHYWLEILSLSGSVGSNPSPRINNNYFKNKKKQKQKKTKKTSINMKQAIIIRQDLKLPKGKLAAQAAHAASEAVLRSEKQKIKDWRKHGMAKIVLKVNGLKEIYEYKQMAKDEGLVTAVITDAGKTVVAPGTVTCCAIGPDEDEKIDSIISELKLL